MASNISVTLVVDNKKYIADLTAAEQATKKFAQTTATSAQAASAGLGKLGNAAGGLHLNLGRLSTVAGAAIGAGFIATAKSALVMANAIDDLSKVTGIAIERIVAFQNAVQQSGGNAEQAAKGITYFYTQIDEAAQGGAKAQVSFQALGVTLKDLATLSEGDLFRKTVEALAEMPASAQKTALQGELLGKAFRNITIDAEFVKNLKEGDTSTKDLAASIKQAADLNDKFEASWTKLRIAFLKTFGPIIEGLADLASFLTKSTILAQILGIALMAIPGAAIGRGAIAAFSLIARGLAGIGRGAGAATTSIGFMNRLIVNQGTNSAQVLRNQATAFGAIAFAATAAGASIYSMFKNAKEAGRQAAIDEHKAAKDAAKGAAEEEARAAREVVDALNQKRLAIQQSYQEYRKGNQSAIDAINAESRLIGMSKEAADAERARSDVMQRSRDEIDRLTAAKAAMSEEDKKLGLGATYDAQIRAIQKVVAVEQERAARATENNNRLITLEKVREFGISRQVELNRELNDLQLQIATTLLPEIAKRYANIEAAAKSAAEAQIASEEARLGRKLDTAEQAKYYEIAAQGVEKLKQKQLELLEVQSKQNFIQFQIKERIDLENQLLKLQDESAKMTLPALEQKYYDIAAAARDSAKAAIEAEEARLGRPLDSSEQAKYYEEAAKGSAKLAKALQENYNKSRTFSTGWKKAFNEYVDNATNAAQRAENLFKKATQGMEDAIVDFAKTGKFEWKGFLASLLEDLLRSQIQQVFAQIFGGMGNTMKGGGSAAGGGGGGDILGGLLGSLGGLFGGGNQQQPAQRSGGGGGGGIGGLLGSIGSGISNVFGGITGAIGGLFGGGSTASGGGIGGGGGILSSIGDLFSGFFANGGMIPQGRFGVAGEAGPELIGGPASVTPMSGTTVTYNINAVDAASFKAMIARDPSFLFAVTEQGRRSLPGGR